MEETLRPSTGSDLVLRNVASSDANILLKWRNLPEVRALSRSTKEIESNEHEKWLSNRLANQLSGDFFFIIDQAGDSVGSVRADEIMQQVFEISIIVDPGYQGRKIGEHAIKLLLVKLIENYESFEICADVHVENFPSIKLFNKLGFEEHGQADNFIQFKKILTR